MLFIVIFLSLTSFSSQTKTNDLTQYLSKARKTLNRNADSCIVYSYRAFELAEAQNDYWAMSKSHTYSGRAWEKKGDIEKAVRDYYSALRSIHLADTTDDYNSGVITRNLANIQMDHRNYEQAVEYYDSTIILFGRHLQDHPEIAQRYGDDKQIYYSQYYKAEGERQLGNIQAAQSTLKQLLENRKIPTNIQLSSIYQIGLIFNDLNEPDSAIRYFKKGIDHQRADSLQIGQGYHNLAMVHFQQEEYQKAITNYTLAASLKENGKDKRPLFISLLDLGESYLMDKQVDRAIESLQAALETLDTLSIRSNRKYFNVYQLMAKAYMPKDATTSRYYLDLYLKSSEEYESIQESLRDEDKKRAFNLFLSQLSIEKEHEEEVVEIEKKSKINQLWVGLAIGILAYLAHLLWRFRKRKSISEKVDKAVRKKRARLS